MKKLTAILLSAIMVISCFSITAYAEETQSFTVTQEFCDVAANYLKEHTDENIFIDRLETYAYFTPENINSHSLITIYKATEDAIIFKLRNYCPPGTSPEDRVYDKIGDYTFCSNYEFTLDNITGHCYYTNGTVYSIREAVEQNLVTLEELAVTIPETTPTPEEVAFIQLFRDYGYSDIIVAAYKQGNVGDYELYYVETSPFPDAMATVRVGNYIFETTYDYTHIRLYLKKDDKIYYLPTAYNEGLITDEDMDVVYSLTGDSSPNWTVTKIELSKEEQMLTEYHKNQGINAFGPENDLYKFNILGELQGYKLCQFCCAYYQPWEWSYEFGKYKADMSVGRPSLFLVNDDTVIELQDAVDDEVITDFDTLYTILTSKGFDVYHKSILTTDEFSAKVNAYLADLGYDYSQLTPENVYDCEWLEIYSQGRWDAVFRIKGQYNNPTKEMHGKYTFNSDTIFHYTNPCGYFLYTGRLFTLGELSGWDEVAKCIPGTTDKDLSNPHSRLVLYLEETNALTKYNSEKARIEKLGKVGDYYLYYGVGDLFYNEAFTETIGNYSFTVNKQEMFDKNSLHLYLVNKDELVVFNSDSYNNGKITDEDVAEVISILNKSESDLFADWTIANDNPIIDDPVGPYLTIAKDKIKSGEKVKLVTVENAEDAEITFKSKTPEIAKINKKGVVKALQKGEAEFEITVGEKTFTAKVKVTNNPKLEQKKIKLSPKATVKIAIKGKVKGIKNVYTDTEIAKIKSKPNFSVLKVKALKKGRTTLKIKVNGVKTLKLKVVVK